MTEEYETKTSYCEASVSTKGIVTFKIKRYVGDNDEDFEQLKQKVLDNISELQSVTLKSAE